MIEPDRFVDPQTSDIAEEGVERALRPKDLNEYVGQEKTRDQLEIFIDAAKKMGANSIVKWTLLGNGPELQLCKKLAGASPNISFEASVAYEKLPARIHQADIILGIFGGSKKAGNVIPNKVFQALACGKTVVTRSSFAYPAKIRKIKQGIFFISPNNSEELKNTIQRLVDNRESIQTNNILAREIYEKNFSQEIIINQLKKVFCNL